MKNRRLLLLLMTVLPWFTVPFIHPKTIKRFLPGSLFMCLYLMIEGSIAERKKWWWFTVNFKPNVIGELPLIFGPFLAGSLWIFKFTYGKFPLYVLLNLIIDAFFVYPFIDWLQRIGYVSLVRLSKLNLSILFLIKSIAMYAFQYLYEACFSAFKAEQMNDNEKKRNI